MSELCLIYSTYPDAASARKAAQGILADKLAACCNILPGLESHYVWEGKAEIAQEVIMLCKTMRAAVPALMQQIKTTHPYETSAVLQLRVDDAEAAFTAWVMESVT